MHWNLLRVKEEIMLLYGIGYKGLVHVRYTTNVKEYLHSL
jgi:hypothetical protein